MLRLFAILICACLVQSFVPHFRPHFRPIISNKRSFRGINPLFSKSDRSPRGHVSKSSKSRGSAGPKGKKDGKNRTGVKKEEKIMKTDVTATNNHQPPWAIATKKQNKQSTTSSTSTTSATSTPDNAIPMNDATLRSLSTWKPFSPYKTPSTLTFLGSLSSTLPSLLTPEIAFLGRSNVGKSSLLNILSSSSQSSHPSDRARVGKTPGATASVNYYSLESEKKPLITFVDLPGFGYAKLSREVKESISLTAEKYLSTSKSLALGVLLLDIRREVSDDDRAVLAALYDMDVPLIIVATKSDKVKDPSLEKLKINKGLGLPPGQPLVVSSETGEGVRDLWKILIEACEELVEEINGVEVEEEEGGFYDDGDGYGEEGEEELMYDQGYDWVQSFGDDQFDDESDSGANYAVDSLDSEATFADINREKQMNDPANQRITLKDSLSRLKKMEKDGRDVL
ncbi:hypothetical protein TrST_g9582 [Triparma strigata]|nr:hypothetical protein TrST_g9582 [Triparma strigata]